MKRKIWMTMNGIEPIIHIEKKDKRCTEIIHYGLFNCFRRIEYHWYNYKLKQRFKKMKFSIIECQCCGGGIAEWTIRVLDEKKDSYACSHCVGFYDINFTRKRLESKWMLEAENDVCRN